MSEIAAIGIVEGYLQEKGWSVSREVKLRGRIADVVAVKEDSITAIEIKGEGGDIYRGVEQALHLKKTAHFAYLAIPFERINEKLKDICRNLGIGLMGIKSQGKSVVVEIVRPQQSNPLPSVKRMLLQKGKRHRIEKPQKVRSCLDILFRSKGQILILKLFFLNPDAQFHISEIARRTGLSASYVLTELKSMHMIGLVTRQEQGNMILYKVNRQNAIYEDLKRIFIKLELIDNIITTHLPAEDITYSLIYGSFAKGTERITSDIDLLVVGKIEEDALLHSIMNIQAETGREINYILWTDEEFKQKVKERTALIREIAKTPVIMLIGEEDEFKRSVEKRTD